MMLGYFKDIFGKLKFDLKFIPQPNLSQYNPISKTYRIFLSSHFKQNHESANSLIYHDFFKKNKKLKLDSFADSLIYRDFFPPKNNIEIGFFCRLAIRRIIFT